MYLDNVQVTCIEYRNDSPNGPLPQEGLPVYSMQITAYFRMEVRARADLGRVEDSQVHLRSFISFSDVSYRSSPYVCCPLTM